MICELCVLELGISIFIILNLGLDSSYILLSRG